MSNNNNILNHYNSTINLIQNNIIPDNGLISNHNLIENNIIPNNDLISNENLNPKNNISLYNLMKQHISNPSLISEIPYLKQLLLLQEKQLNNPQCLKTCPNCTLKFVLIKRHKETACDKAKILLNKILSLS